MPKKYLNQILYFICCLFLTSTKAWGVPTFIVNYDDDNSPTSLRQVIQGASPSDIISFTTDNSSITLDMGTMVITPSNLSIGSAAAHTSLISTGGSGVLQINGTGTILTNLTLQGGNSGGWDGGGIINTANSVTMGNNVTITQNTAGASGGGIYGGYTNITAGDNFTVSNNTAGNEGGGIRVIVGDIDLGKNATISGNQADNYGGGINLSQGNISLGMGSLVQNNISTAGDGGGIYLEAGDVTLQNSTQITGNTAAASGGGLYIYTGNLVTGDATYIARNTASTRDGGGVLVLNGAATFGNNTTITANEAAGRGGGLYVEDDITIFGDNAAISANKSLVIAGGGGGGGGGIMTIKDLTFGNSASIINNEAQLFGGGIYIRDGMLVMGNSATISGNISHNVDGGGIYAGAGDVTIGNDARIVANKASFSGGGIFADTGAVSIGNNATIQGNIAQNREGGGINAEDGDITIGDNSVIVQNIAGTAGGGIYIERGSIAIGKNALIQNNKALAGNGGGLFSDNNGIVTLGSGSRIINNEASLSGGGISSKHTGMILGDNNVVTFNTALQGGGGGLHSDIGDITIGTNATIAHNKAAVAGGGILLEQGILTVGGNAQILNNSVLAGSGGGVYVAGPTTFGVNSVFSGNTVTGAATDTSGLGGAVYVANDFSMQGGTFSNNHAVGGLAGSVSSGRGGAVFFDAANGNQNISFNAGSSSPIIFSGNTHDLAQGTAMRNSLYFGNTAGAGNDYTSTAVFDVAGGGELFMFDPMASQADNLTDSGTTYGNVLLDITKKGEGTWIIGGHNFMQSATDWTIEAGTFHIVSNEANNPSAISHINLSNAQSTFTLGSQGTIMVTPSTSPHLITASSITFESGSKATISGFQYGPTLDNREHVVLQLDTANLDNQSTPENLSGVITVGVYDYAYSNLRWVDDNKLVINLNRLQVNPEVSGGDASGAPTAIAVHSPMPALVFDRANSRFDSRVEDLFCTNSKHERNLWVSGVYSYTHRDNSGNYNSYNLGIPSASVGYDAWITNRAFLGISATYLRPDYKSDDVRILAKGVTAQLYGGVLLSYDLELTGQIGYGFMHYNQEREVKDNTYATSFNSHTVFAGVELGRAFQATENVSVRPMVSYELIAFKQNDYDESFGTYALDFDHSRQEIHRLRAGAEVNWIPTTGVSTGFKAWYQGLYGDTRGRAEASFVGDPDRNSFTSRGSIEDESSLGLGLNAGVELRENITLSGEYGLRFGKTTTSQEGTVTIAIRF